jgi:hypothetical protein
MKTSALTRLVIVLLIVASSCTKENSNITPPATAATHESNDLVSESIDDNLNQLRGEWTIYYTWNCVGDTGSTKMTVKADGTWTSGEGYSGLWVKGRRIFLFTFNHSETTYSGIIFDNKIRGIMSTFDHSKVVYQGCFYMIPYEGSNLKQEHTTGTLDANGTKQ